MGSQCIRGRAPEVAELSLGTRPAGDSPALWRPRASSSLRWHWHHQCRSTMATDRKARGGAAAVARTGVALHRSQNRVSGPQHARGARGSSSSGSCCRCRFLGVLVVPMLPELWSKHVKALDQPRPCPRLLWQATQATLCSSLDGSGARALAGPQRTKPVATVKAVFIISLGPAVLFWIYFNKSGPPASSGLAAGLPLCFRSQS